MSIKSLEPKALWSHFADLNEIPRPSKKEERVIAFMKKFGQGLGLPTQVDKAGNVIIKKPATQGMEDKQTIALQSHLDMVHQKNNDTHFDFDKQGIDMVVEDDWVKAKGTTLGADNGIGVAAIMALLSSKDIPHPALEALFTIDEETGMTGAKELEEGLLEAKIMLNLDTEDDRELTIGCAGGIDVTGSGHYDPAPCPQGKVYYKLGVKGLTGGHSGMDIHLGRGNANKLINRLLHTATEQYGLRISSIDGGGLRNAIPREATAIVVLKSSQADPFESFIIHQNHILQSEYAVTDPSIKITLEHVSRPDHILGDKFQKKLLRSIYAIPNGIYRMDPNIKGLVQTSNNLARILVENGDYTIQCLTRSSVNTEKMDEASAIQSAMELMGAKVERSGDYPGWTPKPDAPIVHTMSDLYRKMYNEEPDVNACHAGLECGIIGNHYPGMDMISFGPNIRGAHSPDEKVQISSVKKFWEFLLATLKNAPRA